MKRTLVLIIGVLLTLGLAAQPTRTRVQRNNNTTNRNNTSNAAAGNDRASLMFPTSVKAADDVVWRRDLYKTIDLTKDRNAALYYPVTPTENRMNLFCTIFRLVNTGKLPVYEYKMDAIEHFDKASRMHFKDMLDRYDIPYEIDGNSIKVEDVDIPSNEVLSYNIKESSYYDQYTATYHSKVVALCPVLHRADDFSMDDVRTSPLFWVKYEDLEPFLNNVIVMPSDINNASTMSAADYFASNQYKGDIYMTTNMQNKSLQQIYDNDSDMVKAQKNIEKQMVDFEKNIWATPVPVDTDTVAVDSLQEGKKVRAAAKARSRSARRSSTSSSSASSSKQSKPKSSGGGSSGARVSVRRERHIY